MATNKSTSAADNTVDKDEHIKSIITSTIHELHADDALKLKKPQTLQGWLYVIATIGGIIGFMAAGIVKLNDIAKHAEEPHHAGVEKLVEEFQKEMTKHSDDSNIHRTEAELELALIKETEPIRQDINTIKQDVRAIQRSVDILVEDNRRKKNNNAP